MSRSLSAKSNARGSKTTREFSVCDALLHAADDTCSSEIEFLKIELRTILAMTDDVSWQVSTPLRNAFFYLPHPKDPKTRAAVHDMASLCVFTRDAFRRQGERSALVTFDPQVVRGIKLALPDLGTAMISSTGCVWILGAKRSDGVDLIRTRVMAIFGAWFAWYTAPTTDEMFS